MATDPTIVQTEDDDAPLTVSRGLRAEAVRRLQIGLTGLLTMLLLVSLANIIRDRAQDTESTTVPNALATAETSTSPVKDPLADAGVVPEMPAAGPSAAAANGSQTSGGTHPH